MFGRWNRVGSNFFSRHILIYLDLFCIHFHGASKKLFCTRPQSRISNENFSDLICIFDIHPPGREKLLDYIFSGFYSILKQFCNSRYLVEKVNEIHQVVWEIVGKEVRGEKEVMATRSLSRKGVLASVTCHRRSPRSSASHFQLKLYM